VDAPPKTIAQCDDGITSLRWCPDNHKTNVTYTTRGEATDSRVTPLSDEPHLSRRPKWYCQHTEDAANHKCYQGCARRPFKSKGLAQPGACNPHVYNVVTSHAKDRQCSDGDTNLKYCASPLFPVNVIQVVKGEVHALGAAAAAVPQADVTLYKISGDMCGQVALDSKYAAPAEKFAALKEGTCASQGFTVAAGTKTVKAPVLGDITVHEYKKPAAGPAQAAVELPGLCGICKWVVDEAKANSGPVADWTTQKVEAALDGVCNKLPGIVQGPCNDLVAKEAPVIVSGIIDKLTDEQVCTTIHVC
jgi:hypothetical protein